LRGRLAWRVMPVFPMVQHCSVFVRREFLLKNKLLFNPTYRIRGDMDWLLRMYQANPSTAYVRRTVALWRWHDQQTSRDWHRGQSETHTVYLGQPVWLALHKAATWSWRPIGRLIKARSVLRLRGWNGLRLATADW